MSEQIPMMRLLLWSMERMPCGRLLLLRHRSFWNPKKVHFWARVGISESWIMDFKSDVGLKQIFLHLVWHLWWFFMHIILIISHFSEHCDATVKVECRLNSLKNFKNLVVNETVFLKNGPLLLYWTCFDQNMYGTCYNREIISYYSIRRTTQQSKNPFKY